MTPAPGGDPIVSPGPSLSSGPLSPLPERVGEGPYVHVPGRHLLGQVSLEYRPIVDAAMEKRMSAALARVWGEPGEAPVQRGSVALMTQEFRAAVAAANA